VPTAGKLLDHVPPVELLLKVMLVAGHSDVDPAMAEGKTLTVTSFVFRHPVLSV
jgi:hypothetical protein